MKTIKYLLSAITLAALFSAPVQATPLYGEIHIIGLSPITLTDSDGNSTTNLNEATGVSVGDDNGFVAYATDSFAPALGAGFGTNTATNSVQYSDFEFAPFNGPITPLWQIIFGGHTWEFELSNITTVVQGGTNLDIYGRGIARMDGGNDTPYASWHMGIVGTNGFTFTSQTVPEPQTLAMMGAGLIIIGALARRRKKS